VAYNSQDHKDIEILVFKAAILENGGCECRPRSKK